MSAGAAEEGSVFSRPAGTSFRNPSLFRKSEISPARSSRRLERVRKIVAPRDDLPEGTYYLSLVEDERLVVEKSLEVRSASGTTGGSSGGPSTGSTQGSPAASGSGPAPSGSATGSSSGQGAHLSVSQSSYGAGQRVTAQYYGEGVRHPAWIGIYKTADLNQPNWPQKYLTYRYVPAPNAGTVEFNAGEISGGEYAAVLFLDGGYGLPGPRAYFTVQGHGNGFTHAPFYGSGIRRCNTTCSVFEFVPGNSAPRNFVGRAQWSCSGEPHSWVGFYKLEASWNKDTLVSGLRTWNWTGANGTGSVPLTTPSEPGTYVMLGFCSGSYDTLSYMSRQIVIY